MTTVQHRTGDLPVACPAAELTGRHAERRALDQLAGLSGPARAGRWWCTASRVSARPRCWSTWPAGAGLPGRRGPPASSRRWSWPSPGCTSCARRCWIGSRRLPVPQREALRTAFGMSAGPRAGPVPGRPGRAEPAVRRWPSSSRWCAWSTTSSGSTVPRRRSSRSWPAGWGRSRSAWSSRRATPASDLAGLPELEVGGLRDGRCARAAGRGAGRADRRAGARPDRRRGARQPAGAAGAAAGTDAGRAGRRVRAARRGALPATSRRASARRVGALPDETRGAAAARGGRPVRRPGAGVAGRRPARDRRRGGGARGRGRPGRVRHPGPVPASAGAVGGLPVGVGRGAAAGARRPGGGHRPAARSRTGAPGTGRRPRPGRTRTSPPSSNARPAGPRRGVGWPPRPRSWSARRC